MSQCALWVHRPGRAPPGETGAEARSQQAHGTGEFEPLAKLTLTAVVPTDEHHDVSFDPTRNGTPGVELGPRWLTALRERAYLRSRPGRNAPDG